MSSILNVSAVSAVPTAPKAQAAQPAAPAQAAQPATPAQPSIIQLTEEPQYELTQQARQGNQMAAQLLAQEQTSTTNQAAGGAPGTGINLLA